MKSELLKKQELASGLGMKFDEVANIFSQETLSTMAMNHVVGGDGANVYCAGGNCVAGCGANAANCSSNTNYACASISASISVSISASVSVSVPIRP